MARPRKYFFLALESVKGLSLTPNDHSSKILNIGGQQFEIIKIHPRKCGVTAIKVE
jgi:hypothetical protein